MLAVVAPFWLSGWSVTSQSATATDSWSVSDATTQRVVTLPRTATDSWTVGDSAVRAPAPRTRTATDTVVGPTDTAARAPGARTRAATDSWAVADTATRPAGVRARTATDAVTFSDLAAVKASTVRAATDTVVVSDRAVVDPSPYAAAVLSDTPVAYWRGGVVSPPVIDAPLVDQSGHGYDLRLWNGGGGTESAYPKNAPSLTSDRGNPAMDFIPKSNFWNQGAGVPAALNIALTSIEMWVKPRAGALSLSTWHDLYVRVSQHLNIEYVAPDYVFSGYAFDFDGDNRTLSAPITPDTTYHVVSTCDGANLKLYVNGTLVSTEPLRGTVTPGSGNIAIGQYQLDANGFDGVMDEIAIYDYALTPARIAAHYTLGAVATSVARAATDTVAVADSAAGTRGRTATATDAWSVVDAAVRSPAPRPRTAVDAWTVVDSAAAAPATRIRPATDAWTVLDTALRAPAARVRAAVDAWTTTDAAGRALALVRAAVDAWSVTSVAVKISGVQVAAVDVVVVSSSAARGPLTSARPAVDLVIVSDSATRSSATRARTATDAWTVLDSAAGIKVTVRTASDVWATSDAALRAAGARARPAVDVVVVSDSALRAADARARALADAWAVADSAAAVKATLRSASDTWTVVDLAGRGSARVRLSAALLGTGTLAASPPRLRWLLTAAPRATGTLSGSVRARARVSAEVQGAGTATASLRVRREMAAALTGVGTFSVSSAMGAAIRARGKLSATLRVRVALDARLDGTGTLLAGLSSHPQALVRFVATGTLTAELQVAIRLHAGVRAAGDLNLERLGNRLKLRSNIRGYSVLRAADLGATYVRLGTGIDPRAVATISTPGTVATGLPEVP